MIPIVSSMVVGSQAKPRRAFVLSLSYILAMAGTYAAVGVAAGLAGANLQATLQSQWLLGSFAALFRSEERRVGQECVRPGSTRLSPDPQKKKYSRKRSQM